MIYQRIFGRTAPRGEKRTHDEMYYVHRDTAKLHLQNSRKETYTLTTPEGLRLKGFYYPAGEEPSGKIAFIVHGYRSTGAEAAGVFQKIYHDRGFDIFAPDNPASGESEGDFISFGYYEGEAVLMWLQYLLIRFGEDVEIVLHGFSLGGGTVLSVSDRIPPQVKFIIDDCGIAGAESCLRGRLGGMYPVLNGMVLLKHDFRFSLGMSDAIPHLKKARCPVLFVHGTEDRTVPLKTTQELARICPTYHETFFVPGAGHVESVHRNRRSYEEKIDRFLEFFS